MLAETGGTMSEKADCINTGIIGIQLEQRVYCLLLSVIAGCYNEVQITVLFYFSVSTAYGATK
jgi:hypothetical protein